jgi:cell division protein FtsL
MPQTGSRMIERNTTVRYTDEVIEGNTVRLSQAIPEVEERELRRTQIEAVRERSLSMNLRYVLFLTISAVTVVMICVYFLRLQATSTKLQKRTVSLQTTLKDLKIENDIEYSEIMSRVDLEDVRDRAISELGMDYPAQSQIVYYDAASSDYVKQYEEIPES